MKKNAMALVTGLLVLITFVMSCNKEETNTSNDPYEAAKAAQGGILYDTFWSSEAGFDQTNPNAVALKTVADFFKCKQCHAWDLKGNLASYIGRAPNKKRPAVANFDMATFVKSKTPKEIFDGIKKTTNRRSIIYNIDNYDPVTNATEGNQMPDYNQLLTDAQIWDLVKFLKEGAFDVTQLYDATTTGAYPSGKITYTNLGKDGDAKKGEAYFTKNCVSCHGKDGKTLLIEELTLGKFFRSKPNEVQHKVKHGQLGSTMKGQFDITLSEMKDLYKFLSDKTTFPD